MVDVKQGRECRRALSVLLAVAANLAATPALSAGAGRSSPTVRDAIEMTRIQQVATADGRIGAFSADGRLLAFVTWRGDLERNVNVYSLNVIDLRQPPDRRAIRSILTREFVGDARDQSASPFEQIIFLNDRTIAYIGRESGKSQQVFSVDIVTQRVTQLTAQATDVREFIAGSSGSVRLFSAVAQSEEDRVRNARMEDDGVLLSEESALGPPKAVKAYSLLELDPRSARQYFLITDSDAPELVYDSRQSRSVVGATAHDDMALRKWATLTPNRQERSALLFPYSPARPARSALSYMGGVGTGNAVLSDWNSKLASPYGLVNLATGHIERFIGPPHIPSGSAGGSGPPAWAPDGRSVLLFVVLSAENAAGTLQPEPQWVEVDLATRRFKSLNVPQGWKVMGWNASGTGAVLNKDNRFAVVRRTSGRWGGLNDLGTFENVNWRWTPATNGEVIIGVGESIQSPPELVAIDLKTKQTTVLTDLNPNLKKRDYGIVENFRWSHKNDDQASGLLIKPRDFDPSKRYPLIVLLDDGTLKRIEQFYLLDGFMQLSGHAIQPLAAEGFLVLYTREPRVSIGKPDECALMQEHIHAAVEKLGHDGLIDPNRVGLSGWSRAGYHTDCILMDPRSRFAAASQIDGGGMEYVPRLRPYTDEQLLSISAPLLIEAHGPRSLIGLGAMADRLEAFGRPAELLYFQSAPHSTVRPQHRRRSLETHLDWWRFWLKDEEDRDPKKAEQLRRWKMMRAQWAMTISRRKADWRTRAVTGTHTVFDSLR